MSILPRQAKATAKMPEPAAGDIAWVDFGETLGTEQRGRRPALLLTPLIYHQTSTRAIVCPITSKSRNWPTDVPLPAGLKTSGFVLVDQIRAIDRTYRLFDVVEHVPRSFVLEIQKTLATLLNFKMAGVES